MNLINITFDLTEDSIDEEMNDNINKIMNAFGWTRELVIQATFQYGCKWYLKDQLKWIVNTQI
jgi:hypothetical protein